MSDVVILRSGRVLNAYGLVYGISLMSHKAFEGYDGSLGEYEDNFTPEEKQEIAEMIIAAYKKWADA